MRPCQGAGGGVPILAAHGFGYDPGDAGHNDPDADVFPTMDAAFGREVVRISYYSIPFGFRWHRPVTSLVNTVGSLAGSWVRGRWHPYRRAYQDRAPVGAAKMVKTALAIEGPVDLAGHSLGAWVCGLALKELPPGKVRRVTLICGAALWRQLRPIVEGRPETFVVSVHAEGDRILSKLGARFSPKTGGVFSRLCQIVIPDPAACVGLLPWEVAAPANFLSLPLDDARVQALGRARGWDLEGNNPDSRWNHWYAYREARNWPLYRAIAEGDPLGDFTAPGP